MSFETWQRAASLTEADMVRGLCPELSQADLKAIGQSRQFDPEIVARPSCSSICFFPTKGWRLPPLR